MKSCLIIFIVFELWIQVVKLYAWEKAFMKVISDYRMGEILMYIRFYLINAFSMHSNDRSERLEVRHRASKS